MKAGRSGVALITVLIVVAMVSAAASWLMKSQFVSIQRAARVISQEQAIVHAFGAEPLILRLLFSKDANKKADYYTLWYRRYETSEGYTRVPEWEDERWSKPWDLNSRNFVEFSNIGALRNVSWKVCVQDMNALIDLNALYRSFESKSGIWTKYDFMRSVLLNLFRQSYLGEPDDPDTPTPEALYDALHDWFDKDDRTRNYGAEDSDYELKKPPYRTAAMRMAWPEEIHLVNGFNQDVTKDFINVLTALPFTLQDSEAGSDLRLVHKINLNTAPREVLQTLPGLQKDNDAGQEVIRELLAYRQDGNEPALTSFKDAALANRIYETLCLEGEDTSKDAERSDPQWRICNFWNPTPVGRTALAPQYLGFKSDLFLTAVQINTGDFSNDMQLLIYRKSGERGSHKPYIVQRRFGKGYYNACTSAKQGSEAIKGR